MPRKGSVPANWRKLEEAAETKATIAWALDELDQLARQADGHLCVKLMARIALLRGTLGLEPPCPDGKQTEFFV